MAVIEDRGRAKGAQVRDDDDDDEGAQAEE